MLKSPYLHSILASAYIFLVVFVMDNGTRNVQGRDETLMIPVMVLSLLTLSVSVMAYLFFYKPVMLFLDGKKRESLNFFLQTLTGFAVITAIITALVFSKIL